MFEIGRILWIMTAPANLLVIVLCVAWFLMRRSGSGLARNLIGVTAVLSLVIAITPLGRAPLLLLEDRFSRPPLLPARVDGIVVLGGGILPLVSLSRDEPVMLASGNVRLAAFVDLARRYPQARLVFSGGAGNPFAPALKEAAVARVAVERMGLESDRAKFEDNSRNTHENAKFSKEMMAPSREETWLLVTSASHMPRAVGAFRAVGWDVVPYPVGYLTSGDPLAGWGFDFLGGLASLQTGIREWIGLFSYYSAGQIDDLFPGP